MEDRRLRCRSRVLETAKPLLEWEHRGPLGVVWTTGEEERMTEAIKAAGAFFRSFGRGREPRPEEGSVLDRVYHENE